MADGSLKFDTRIDNTGFKKELKELQSIAANNAKEIAKQLEQATKVYEEKSGKLKAFENAGFTKDMIDPAFIEEVNQAKQVVDNLSSSLQEAQMEEATYKQQLEAIANAEKAASSAKRNQTQSIRTGILAQKEAQAASNAQTAAIRKETAALKLKGAQERANAKMVKASVARSQSAIAMLGSRTRSLIGSVFVFSLLNSAFTALRTYIGGALSKNAEFAASLASLKGAFFTAFYPIYQVAIPALITLMNILTQVLRALASFFAMISGKSLAATAASAEAMHGESKAIGAAGGAAEKASKQMASFDEINQLSDTAGGGGAGGGGGGSGGDIAPDFDMSAVDEASEKFRLIRDLVVAIGAGLLGWKIARTFGASLKNCWGIFMLIAGSLLLVLGYSDAWVNGVNWGNLIEMLAGAALFIGGLALLFGITAAGVGALVIGIALLVLAFKDIINNGFTVENTLLLIAGAAAVILGVVLLFGAAAGAIVALVIGIGLLAVGLYQLITTGEMTTETFFLLEAGILAVGIALGILVGWPALVIAAIVALALAIYQYWDEIVVFMSEVWKNIVGFFSDAWDRICEIWGVVATWFNEHVIQPIQNFFSPLTELFRALFEGAWIIIQAIWQVVATWFNEHVIMPLKNFFSPAVEFIKGLFSDLWTGVQNIWSAAVGWFKDSVLNPLQKAFETVFKGIKNFARGIFNGLIGLVEGLVNRVIDGINKFLGFFSSIASWGASVIGVDFGGIPKVSRISLPRLAQGAVIPANSEFLAVLGDQKSGTNIEAPLETIVAAMQKALQTSGGNNRTIVFEIDKRKFAEIVFDLYSIESKRIGVKV